MSSKSRIGRLSPPEVSSQEEPVEAVFSVPEEPASPPQRRLQLWIPEDLYIRMATYKNHHRSRA